MSKRQILSYILVIVSGFICYTSFSSSAMTVRTFKDETMQYVVTYKWGVIHKDAANVTLSLRGNGPNYSLKLTAKTLPWADKYFRVRDTLISVVGKQNFQPLSYSKISHEGKRYSRDDIKYSYHGTKIIADVIRTRQSEKSPLTKESRCFTATGEAYDMLSVFYFLRLLDFTALEKTGTRSTNIFSGSKVESLTIRYIGRELLKMRGGTKREAIKISFRFTTGGKKKSSDNIEAWVSADPEHIPLQIVGKLPIGSINIYLVKG